MIREDSPAMPTPTAPQTAPEAAVSTETIPESAGAVRIIETGEVWWRLYGGQFDGLWTTDDGPTAPTSGRNLRSTSWLAHSGTVEVVETD